MLTAKKGVYYYRSYIFDPETARGMRGNEMKRRTAISWLLTACMVLTMLPQGAVRASAAEIIVDIDDNSNTGVVVDIPDDPDPTIIVDLPDDPADNAVIIVNMNMTGSGRANDPYIIYTPKGLQIIQNMWAQGNNFSGYHIWLGADLDLSGICGSETGDWVPIGTSTRPFYGSFDGRGHTISGLYIGEAKQNNGLFGVMNGEVRNLTVNGRMFAGDDSGGIAGVNQGTISHCVFAGTIEKYGSAVTNVGGIAGTNRGFIDHCTHKGTIRAFTGSNIGGIAGLAQSGSIEDCVNEGDVGNPMASTHRNCGGIVGYYEGGSLSSCRNEGDVLGGGNVGGIAGSAAENRKLSGFVNTGSVTGRGDAVGGIIGRSEYLSGISDCHNAGSITGPDKTGGIVGYVIRTKIMNCTNAGSVGITENTGNGAKGGIAGYLDAQGIVSYCSNSGSITTEGNEKNYGGIVGQVDNATRIDHCYNTGRVFCSENAGGIIGYVYFSKINCCFNTGTVSGSLPTGISFGGIVGSSRTTDIKNCFNTGRIAGERHIGGIAGIFDEGSFENCVNKSEISGLTDIGGLVGCRLTHNNDWAKSIFTHNYYRSVITAPVSSGVGGWEDNEFTIENVLRITEEQYTAGPDGDVYKGWDFTNIWYMMPAGPRLRSMVNGDNAEVIISSVEDLRRFRDSCNAGVGYKDVTVKLAANLDLTGETNWIPIADTKDFKSTYFSGTFDGCGYTISGLTMDRNTFFGSGLFGNVDGTIKNLTVKGDVKSNAACGGIAVHLEKGTIENCNFDGVIEGEFRVGGIVGTMENRATVRGCMVRGNVNARSNNSDTGYCSAGGIAGEVLANCTVEECIARVTVSGLNGTGGIAGYFASALMQNCLHEGDVSSSTEAVGGVAGIAAFGLMTNGAVRNCYHYNGKIKSGSQYLTGGVVGSLPGAVTSSVGVEHCYYLEGTVFPSSQADDWGIGRPYSLTFLSMDQDPPGVAEALSLQEFKAESSFDQWDFTDVWAMNADRPLLRDTGLKDLSAAVINLGTQKIYDGTEQSVVIDSVTMNGVPIVEYEIIAGETATDVEATTLTIAGTGFCTGTKSIVWSLQKAVPVRSDFTTVSPGSANYTGDPVDVTAPVAKHSGIGAVTLRYTPEGHTDAGRYAVSFDVAESQNYAAASDIVFGQLTINKIEDPAVVNGTASVEAGASVDLSGNVSGAQGTVTYAIDGNALDCSVNETTGIFTAGAYGGTVTVTVTIADSTNHNGREETIAVKVNGAPPKDISGAVITLGTQNVYNGTEQSVVIDLVTLDGAAFVDYEISSGGTATDVGDTMLEISGTGVYTGTATAVWSLQKAVPTEADFTITPPGSRDFTGQPIEVQAPVSARTGMGAVSVQYDPAGHTEAGEYEVSFDVAEGSNYTAAKGLSIGTLTIAKAGETVETVALPVLSEGSQTFRDKLDVTISCATTGAAIRYTLDGSDPTKDSGIYMPGSVITIEETVTLKAIAILDGFKDSGIAEAVYTKAEEPQENAPRERKTHTVKPQTSENGEISAFPKHASAGDTVTVSCTPDEGYEVSRLTIRDKYGNEIEVSKTGDKYSFTMPSSAVEIEAVFEKIERQSSPDDFPFTDVPADAYFRKAVEWALKNDITGGTSPKTFSPMEPATRAQIVTFLWIASGSPEPEGTENPFTDVTEGDYFYKAVLWAYEQGITAGVSADRFGSEQPVTRAQAVTFLYNMAGRPAAGSEPFDDVNEGDYFAEAVACAYENGITAGTSETAFSPDMTCLRGQIITFLYIAFEAE